MLHLLSSSKTLSKVVAVFSFRFDRAETNERQALLLCDLEGSVLPFFHTEKSSIYDGHIHPCLSIHLSTFLSPNSRDLYWIFQPVEAVLESLLTHSHDLPWFCSLPFYQTRVVSLKLAKRLKVASIMGCVYICCTSAACYLTLSYQILLFICNVVIYACIDC